MGYDSDGRYERSPRDDAFRPPPPPPIPEGLDPKMLDRAILRDLNTLGTLADKVALHLVAAGMLMDTDDAGALAHARAARDLAPRIAAVREAAGLAAYHNEEWAEAARDLRAARRMTGDNSHLPILADCERALGKPERALEIATGPEVESLPRAVQAELVIVHAGARRDLGELAAAKRILERFGVDESVVQPWSVRTWYAYADVLVALGDLDGARHWFEAVSELDRDGETDAEERLETLGTD